LSAIIVPVLIWGETENKVYVLALSLNRSARFKIIFI